MTNFARLIELLKDGLWHTDKELVEKVSHRFGHTIYEARKKGCMIEKRSVGGNRYEYRMLKVGILS